MDVILVPGLWLDGSSWEDVSSRLRDAGHVPHPLTLRGLSARTADRSGVLLADHVSLIANTIDQMGGPVALVGHAEACGLVHAAVNRRPDRVARAFHVGGLPSADGTYVLTGFHADAHRDTTEFAERCARDGSLAALRERQRVEDGHGVDSRQRLTDKRRFDVPVTIVASEYTTDDVRRWMSEDADPARELVRMRDVTLVDLPAGHWPQFERGAELTRVIVDGLSAHARSAA
ncbi:alpha/beta fold hydrolase [Microbacterium abyssi]|uniref:alpha/beta fold hydrolase n=1 Tax=Microbacterium abyssi TaxID=2782166 RepID=UPI001889BB8C|nr:alpha/beta hydrolase [Microbacterium sp. A18JL241]